MSNTTRETSVPPNGIQRVPVTSRSISDLRLVSDAQLSPDGQSTVCVVREVLAGQSKFSGYLWKAVIGEGEAEPILHGKKHSAHPRWSPDGKWLAFLAMEESEHEKRQLYLLPATGGEARQVCSMPDGIGEFSWSPDSRRIAFLSSDDQEAQRDPKVFTPGSGRHQRLWTVLLDAALPQVVTPRGTTIWDYTWAPDGKQLAVYYSSEPEVTGWYRSQIGLVPSGGGAIHQVTHLAPVSMQVRSLAWSPDGRQLAFISGRWSDPGRGAGEIYTLDLESGESQNLSSDITSSPTWCAWFPDSQRLLYAAVSGVTHQVGTLDTLAGTVSVLEHDFVMYRDQPVLSPSADFTRFAALHSTPQQPVDVYLGIFAEREAAEETPIAWQRVTRLNPIPEETWAPANCQRIEYASTDGVIVHGLLNLPATDKKGSPPPLFVDVHGGPSGSYCDEWSLGYPQWLATAGYAVLRVNYRGSWGRGSAFANAVIGDMGGQDFQDIQAGIDYVIAQGWADGERLAIGGWSNGGFMAAWAVTQTRRFKAAVMGAGIADWQNMHAQTNIPDADMLLLDADPFQQPATYARHSPLTFVEQVTTPTLILHGEDDPAVPVAQAYAFYRALNERQVPVEMAIYPREGHGLGEMPHIFDADQRVLRWLEQHVG